MTLYLGLAITSEESSDEAGVGPITPKEDFDLESRPFLQAVFTALNCSENDYLVLFGICLLRAIQGNEGTNFIFSYVYRFLMSAIYYLIFEPNFVTSKLLAVTLLHIRYFLVNKYYMRYEKHDIY